MRTDPTIENLISDSAHTRKVIRRGGERMTRWLRSSVSIHKGESLRPSSFEVLEPRRLFSGHPTISIGDVSMAEGNASTTNAAVVVSLSGSRPHQAVTVNYATQNGTATGADYLATSAKLTFAPGETSKTILVPVKGDRIVESDEYFVVNLHGAMNAKIADGQAIVTIVDDEPRISIDDVSGLEGNSGTKAFTFTVSLPAVYDQDVTVKYTTSDGSATAGSDYAASTGTLTFQPGQTSQTITVLINGDRLVEPNETFFVNLSNPSSNAAISRDLGVGTIIDDEPRISIADAWNYGDTSPFIFTVSLSAASDEVVTVNFTTVDDTAVAGADYISASGTLTFDPGQTSQTISVVVLNPTSVGQYFHVLLSDATNAPILTEQAYGYWYYDYGGGWDYYYYGDYYGWY